MPELDSQRATTALSTRKWGSSEVDRSWWAVPYVPDPKAGSSSASGALGAEYNDWRQVRAHCNTHCSRTSNCMRAPCSMRMLFSRMPLIFAHAVGTLCGLVDACRAGISVT
eukprot:1130698-Rhodomonas_salina.6